MNLQFQLYDWRHQRLLNSHGAPHSRLLSKLLGSSICFKVFKRPFLVPIKTLPLKRLNLNENSSNSFQVLRDLNGNRPSLETNREIFQIKKFFSQLFFEKNTEFKKILQQKICLNKRKKCVFAMNVFWSFFLRKFVKNFFSYVFFFKTFFFSFFISLSFVSFLNFLSKNLSAEGMNHNNTDP